VADAGDQFVVAPDEKVARSVASTREHWQRLASLVSMLNGPGPLGASVEVLTFYAGIADELARAEIAMVDHSADREQLLEQMVTGSVVYGQVFGLLRQLGHEHHHALVTQAATVAT